MLIYVFMFKNYLMMHIYIYTDYRKSSNVSYPRTKYIIATFARHPSLGIAQWLL